MKQIIRLTESDLHRIIKKSVSKILEEIDDYEDEPFDVKKKRYEDEMDFRDNYDWDAEYFDITELDPESYIEDSFDPNDNYLYNWGNW